MVMQMMKLTMMVMMILTILGGRVSSYKRESLLPPSTTCYWLPGDYGDYGDDVIVTMMMVIKMITTMMIMMTNVMMIIITSSDSAKEIDLESDLGKKQMQL